MRHGWRPWRQAMAEALYGPAGFYRSSGAPASHFRTAAHTGPEWAEALTALAERVDEHLGRPAGFTVVDLGAGGGELIAGLAATAASGWRLVGVDVAPRPAELPARVEWLEAPPESFEGIVLAVEWLDVVPVDVVELTDDGPRIVEVSESGGERPGGPPVGEDSAWLDAWWPLGDVGDRAEIGRSRDDAWRDMIARLSRGLAVAVDYAAVPQRDVAGTLTGYRAGRQVAPVPDGSMDVTAHVLIESLAAAVPDVDVALLSQRDALHELGVHGARPSYDGDPAAYLSGLSRAGAAAELLDPGGLGAFTWLVVAKGVEMPIGVAAGQPTARGRPNATSRTPSE